MKKVLFAALTLACALIFSCGDELPERLQNDFPYTESVDLPIDFGSSQIHDLKSDGDYIYKYHNGMLYRLNPRTGNVTSVCGDPLCRHNSPDCPLYGMSGVYHFTDSGEICCAVNYSTKVKNAVTGEYETKKVNQFIRYDAESLKNVVIDDFGEQSLILGPEIYSGNWRIYVGQEYDAENDKLIYGLRRADVDSGKNAFWGGEKLADGTYKPLDNVEPLFTLDGRFWFNDGRYIFSLDEDGGNRVNHLEPGIPLASGRIQTDGEWLYYVSPKNVITRTGLSGGRAEVIVNDESYSGYPFVLTENYIYYQAGSPISVGKADIPGYAADEIILNGENILRCRHDGSEKELVCTFDGTLRPTQWIVVGNYLYCSFTRWDDADSDGVFHREDMYFSDDIGCELLRVDLSTGEKRGLTIVKQEAK